MSVPDLLLGWDRREITPSGPTALAGFAMRAGLPPASQVVSPLHLRTVALQQAGRRCVVIVGDLLCWGPDNMARIEAEAAERFGLAPDELLVSATHTHSAPQPSTWFPTGLGVADPDWVEHLHRSVIDGVAAALERPVPVTVEFAQGHHRLGVERRFARSGGAERAAPLPQRLSVINFRAGDGIVATLFHHACHPTLHHANAVTADFPGAAMGAVEQDGAEIALYLQGCCGNVNPDRYQGTTFRAGDAADIRALGGRLAAAVRELAAVGTRVAPRLGTGRRRVELPTEPAPATDDLAGIAAGDDQMTAGWAQLLLARPQRRSGAPVTVSRLHLGDGLQLLGLSGEPTSPYADHVTGALGERALTLGYCNGMLGYLVSATQLADGGYESREAPYWFGMPGPLAPQAEAVLQRALVELGTAPTAA